MKNGTLTLPEAYFKAITWGVGAAVATFLGVLMWRLANKGVDRLFQEEK